MTIAKAGFVGEGGREGEVASFREISQLLGWRDHKVQEEMASRDLNGIRLPYSSMRAPLIYLLITRCRSVRPTSRNVVNTLGLSLCSIKHSKCALSYILVVTRDRLSGKPEICVNGCNFVRPLP